MEPQNDLFIIQRLFNRNVTASTQNKHCGMNCQGGGDLQNTWESLRRSSSSKLVQIRRWKPLEIPITLQVAGLAKSQYSIQDYVQRPVRITQHSCTEVWRWGPCNDVCKIRADTHKKARSRSRGDVPIGSLN